MFTIANFNGEFISELTIHRIFAVFTQIFANKQSYCFLFPCWIPFYAVTCNNVQSGLSAGIVRFVRIKQVFAVSKFGIEEIPKVAPFLIPGRLGKQSKKTHCHGKNQISGYFFV